MMEFENEYKKETGKEAYPGMPCRLMPNNQCQMITSKYSTEFVSWLKRKLNELTPKKPTNGTTTFCGCCGKKLTDEDYEINYSVKTCKRCCGMAGCYKEQSLECPNAECEYYIDKEKSYHCLQLEKGNICARRWPDLFKQKEK